MPQLKFKDSILFKVGVSILIPVSLIFAIMFYLLYVNIQELTEEKYINQLHEINLNYTDYITDKLDGLSSKTKLIANEIERGRISVDDFLEVTNDITLSDDLVYGSAIALAPKAFNNNEMGFYYSFKSKNSIKHIQFTSSEDKSYFNYQHSNLEWWKTPSSVHHNGWTKPYFDYDAGQTDMVTFFQPFFNNGRFLGIITVDVSIDLLKEILLSHEKHFEENIPTDIFLFSSDSTLVYADNTVLIGRNVLKEVRSKVPENEVEERKIISNAISGKVGRQKFYSNTFKEEKFAFYSPIISTNWHSIAVIPYSFIQDSIFSKMLRTIMFLITVTLIILVIIYIISNSITSPIKKLSHASIGIAEGNYDMNIKLNTKSELGLLASNFNSMSNKLKQRENDLIIANEELKVLDDAKTKFLLLISHEIRTPLNGIIGFTDIIHESIKDPEILEFGDLLKQSVNRLDIFSRKALDITQLQTRFNTLTKSDINVSNIIIEIIETKEEEITLKRIKVNKTLQKDVIHNGFPEYFTGMLVELIENAIVHSDPNSIVDISLEINPDGHPSFSIKNKGEIIPSDKLFLVLQPFGLAQKHIDQNIGLGLYYVKTYLEILEAKFDIQSDENGTVFSFELMN